MSLIDRLGDVVRSEWNSRFTEDDDDAPRKDGPTRGPHKAARRPAPSGGSRVPDVASARRILEVSADATLDEVRGAYATLARRYHPRSLGAGDKAYAAQTLLDSLTDALEVLEAHLLPLPDGTRD
jgi:hypothetical protein